MVSARPSPGQPALQTHKLSIAPPSGEPARAFVARQAILDRSGKTWAYQLLYRDGPAFSAKYADAQSATATVMLNVFMDMGIENVVDDKRVFVQLTQQMFLESYSQLLSKYRVIVQLPGDTQADAATCSALANIRAMGHQIAHGNFRLDSPARDLARFCNYAKVDVSAYGRDELKKCLDFLGNGPAKPIAHKVETARQYQECRELGFSYFQGYYLSDPRVLDQRRPATNVERLTELLRLLNQPNGGINEIESVIKGDVTLMYRLLRYLGSAAFALPQPISSVRQAIVLLGLENLKRWATVLVLANVKDQPIELLRIALIRARMCKNLTYYIGGNADTLFMVGLFSVLDALFSRPMEELLRSLPLTQDVSEALLFRRGRAGEVLGCVIGYERGHWTAAELEGCESADIASAWFRAVEWTDRVIPALG